MYLKSIEIQGFKSFPDRTRIDFHTGMTAIVGPNGSGKSNVTDAIRWVLGEQSVKTLRGHKMEDVIFSGTQSRRPLSYAEVTITFDNQSGLLPIDFTEVAVTRRLYRSGESEYLLNRTTCRLKDIHHLFLDTGLGRDGYSIVGQGRVEELLSNRSEDRRRVFEEAAGIAKLRVQREETERHLRQTEQNLDRLEDILGEITHRLEPLALQAEKAKTYRSLQDVLTRHDKTLAHRQVYEIETKTQQLTTQLEQIQEEILGARADEEGREAAYQALLQEGQNADLRVQELREQGEELQQSLVQHSADRAATAQEKQALSLEQAQLQERLKGQEQGLLDLATEQETYRRSAEKAEVELRTATQGVEVATQALAAAQKKRDQFVATRAALHETITSHQTDYYKYQTLVTEAQSALRTLKTLQDEQGQAWASLQKECEEAEAGAQAVQLTQKELEQELADKQEQLREALQDLEEARAYFQSCEEEKEKLSREGERLQYQYQTLSRLEASYEGYSTAVQGLLSQQQGLRAEERQGVRGTVGELIRVPEQYEVAIEVALGPSVQHIVTDTDQTASRCIGMLKKRNLGRATFLPLNALRVKTVDSKLLSIAVRCPGYLGQASELVETAKGESLDTLLPYLLGSVLLVDTLEHARFLARETQHRLRIVTLDGEILAPGGAMTGGSLKSKRPHLLGRTRELEETNRRLQALPSLQENASEALARARVELLQSGESLETLQQEQRERENERIRLQMRGAEMANRLEGIRERLARLTDAKTERETEENQLKEQLEQAKREADRHWEQITDLQEKSREQDDQSANLEKACEQAQQALGEVRLQQERVRNDWAQAQTLLERLTQDEQTRQLELEQAKERLAQIVQEQQALTLRASESDAKGVSLQEAVEVNRLALKELEEARAQRDSKRESTLKAIREAAEHRSRLALEKERIQGQQETLKTREEQIRLHLWEEYDCVLEQIQPEDLLDDSITLPALRKEAESLRNKLRNLGSVNPQAVEEYQALKERHEFLVQQQTDILTAKAQLDGIITEVTTAMRERFLSSVTEINENFDRIFQSLFGGGQAAIQLGEAEDVLLAPIEIKASPPGKRLQNMLLLSGGERALTAIALLFAILNRRPTPFVVLDEIEAALDDANVLRFTDYIRENAEHSQFILVTHRKGTMESCDRIYGVTMQERGVSRILSMQLTAGALDMQD